MDCSVGDHKLYYFKRSFEDFIESIGISTPDPDKHVHIGVSDSLAKYEASAYMFGSKNPCKTGSYWRKKIKWEQKITLWKQHVSLF